MRICYVESPLQLTGSMEYNSTNSSDRIIYLIRDNGNEIQRAQFNKILSDEQDFSFIKIPRKGVLKKILMFPRFFSFILIYIFRVKEFLVGDARSLYVKIIYIMARAFRKEVVLVDDGTYLINYCKKIERKKYTIFTSLPLESCCNSSSLKVIEKPFELIDLRQEQASVFIGMPIVELGFMSLDSYLQVMDVVSERSVYGRNVYYAHRSESDDKLNHVRKLGFEVVRPDLPIEMFLKKNGAYKGDYYSFYSTALYNLSKMVRMSGFVSFRPRPNMWPHAYRAEILDCYKLLELTSEIMIVELTDNDTARNR